MEMDLWADWPTDNMDGLIWSLLFTSFHFLSSVCKSLTERDVSAECVSVRCSHTCACVLLQQGLNQWLAAFRETHIRTPPWLFICFQHVSLCRCRCSHGLPLIRWRAHVILNRCSCSIWKHCCYTSKPKLSSVFEDIPKNKCHWSAWKLFTDDQKTHTATSFLLAPPPFSFSFFVPALLHSVWDTTLCDFRKAQRYLPYFFMYLWLMSYSGWFWSWMNWQALECMVISDL